VLTVVVVGDDWFVECQSGSVLDVVGDHWSEEGILQSIHFEFQHHLQSFQFDSSHSCPIFPQFLPGLHVSY